MSAMTRWDSALQALSLRCAMYACLLGTIDTTPLWLVKGTALCMLRKAVQSIGRWLKLVSVKNGFRVRHRGSVRDLSILEVRK